MQGSNILKTSFETSLSKNVSGSWEALKTAGQITQINKILHVSYCCYITCMTCYVRYDGEIKSSESWNCKTFIALFFEMLLQQNVATYKYVLLFISIRQ